jgi:hypothetical protein
MTTRMPQPFPDLSDAENDRVWQICCQQGVNRIQARAIFNAECKALALADETMETFEAQQPEESEVDSEEQPLSEEENDDYDVDADSVQETQIRMRTLMNEKQKSRILDKIEARLDEEETAEQRVDDLSRFIKSDEIIEKMTRSFLSSLISFSTLKGVDRVTITLQRNGDKVNYTVKMVDKNGKDIMFTPDGKSQVITSDSP